MRASSERAARTRRKRVSFKRQLSTAPALCRGVSEKRDCHETRLLFPPRKDTQRHGSGRGAAHAPVAEATRCARSSHLIDTPCDAINLDPGAILFSSALPAPTRPSIGVGPASRSCELWWWARDLCEQRWALPGDHCGAFSRNSLITGALGEIIALGQASPSEDAACCIKVVCIWTEI